MSLTNQFPNIVYTLVNGKPVAAGSINVGSDGQLIFTPSGGSGSSPLEVFDPVNNVYYALTATGKVLTLSSPASSQAVTIDSTTGKVLNSGSLLNAPGGISAVVPQTYYASYFGAKADAVTVYDGTFTSGSNIFGSASSNFTSANIGQTVILQLSATSRQVLTFTGLGADAQHMIMSANATANSSAYAFGITTYGTENTLALRNAVTASINGTLILDGGTYIVTGAPLDSSTINAIFEVPFITTANSANLSLTVKGVGVPAFALENTPQVPGLSGTILYCTNQTVSGTNPCVFGCVSSTYAGGSWGFAQTCFRLEGVTIRQPANPFMSGINWLKGGGLEVDNCAFDLDFPFSSAANLVPDPNTGAAVAIICPKSNNNAWVKITNTYVYGYNTGFYLGEHSEVDHSFIDFCRVGIKCSGSTHDMHIGRLCIARCRISVNAPDSSCNLTIDNLDIESARGATTFIPSWCVWVGYDIDNFSGGWAGKWNVYTIIANSGVGRTVVRGPNGQPNNLTLFDLFLNSYIGGVNSNNMTLTAGTAPAAPTLTTSGTAGSTSYTYQVATVLMDGTTIPGPTATIATGNATLNSTNSINLSWTAVAGAANYYVYRTASGGTPASVGKIGATLLGTSFSDTGIAGDSSVAVNNTGALSARVLQVKEGSNAKQGTGTLVNGTVTIANTSVTANSRIQVTGSATNSSTGIGAIRVTSQTANTGFTVTALGPTALTVAGDQSSFAYEIFEPA